MKSKEKWEKELDIWLESDEHKFNCASYNEGQYCCLDKEFSVLGGKTGREGFAIS